MDSASSRERTLAMPGRERWVLGGEAAAAAAAVAVAAAAAVVVKKRGGGHLSARSAQPSLT